MDLFRITTLAELKDLLDLLGQFDIGEFEIEADGRKLRVSKGGPASQPQAFAFMPAPAAIPTGATAGPSAAEEVSPRGDGATAALPAGVKLVTSPMVGTFYRAPSPEADPFVDVGDRVTEDSTVCIIEAMKVMNEIPAGVGGVVKEILVKNGESVEFGQPIFHIVPD